MFVFGFFWFVGVVVVVCVVGVAGDVADVTDAEAGGVVEAIGDPTEVVGSSQKLVARRSLSFSTGTFNDQRRPPASPSSGRERVAALHVQQSCEGCGGPLGAPEATAGWFARHQRDPAKDGEYGSDCPRCGTIWHPKLRVELTRVQPSAIVVSNGAIECPLLSPCLLYTSPSPRDRG